MADAVTVRVNLLGGFTAQVGSTHIPDGAWRLRKARAVVKLLALAPGKRLPWERLGETLWPEGDVAAVRNSLHQALRAGRAALAAGGVDGRAVLRLHEGVVAFGDAVEVWVDVDAFTAAAARARGSGSVAAYRAAVALYGGELLPEDRYADWVEGPRQALREQHAALLLELAGVHRERGEVAAALDTLRTLVVHDALHEPARRELMQLLATAGRRQEALAEYESLRDTLRRELEADPDPETRRLYRRLLSGSLHEAPAGPGAPEGGEDPVAGNLPAATSSFVGREREVAEIDRLLERTRLLTLTGVGGSGKTRLALEVARRKVGRTEHGVWLVELAPTTDPAQVPQAISDALGLELPERGPPITALVDQLSTRRLLLVLDNCEHLIGACADVVGAILRSCPGVAVLATSREALRVDGEVAWRVPSLALPDLGRLPPLARLARLAAVELFCERARAADPRFELTARNARSVAQLCVRLDGMPLALELAAARVSALSPRQILTRLDALDALAGGIRAGVTRQATLAATLDWSHELLADPERVLFRRLAVFAGSFSLEAAEAVCGADPLTPAAVLALLSRLVDQSLVAKQPHGDVVRYRLLEIVRQYALTHLAAAGERPLIEAAHRRWYRAWAAANDPERSASEAEGTLHHFDVEHDNLRAALHSALAGEPEAALELATSLWRFWLARGHFAEGRRWLEGALDANQHPTALRARGLLGRAILDMRSATGQARVERVAREVIAIHHALDDGAALAQAHHLAAVLLWTAHDWTDAFHQLDRADELATEHAAEHVLAAARHTRAVIELSRGQPGAAQAHLEACSATLGRLRSTDWGFFPAISVGLPLEWDDGRPRLVFEETIVMGHRLDVEPAAAHVRFSQAWVARASGDHDSALAHAKASAAAFAAAGWDYGVALAHNLLGSLQRRAGALSAARRSLERGLQLRAKLGDRRATGVSLGGLGLLAAAEGDSAGAQRHLQRALALFERIEDGFGIAGTLLNLGVSALRAGELDSAQRLLDQLEELGVAPGGRRPIGWVAVMLAEIAERRGDAAGAAARLAQARSIFADLGELAGLRYCDAGVPDEPLQQR
jgi:predicted ATPase/DNA-binding SARP family transcriptional activator